MFNTDLNRRQMLSSAVAVPTGLALPLCGAEPVPTEPFPKDGAEALARLKAGNARFVVGQTRHAHQSADWRKHLVGGQQPIATILSCSDSRVPPELVFDQGFGDLFIVRVAGNVIATDVVGSIAYAALHLNTPLFVVMGHAGCGAVTAAVQAIVKQAEEPQSIEALVKLIEPGLKELDLESPFPKLLATAIEANVRWSVQQLAVLPGAREGMNSGKITLVGAVYELETGKVRFLM